MVLLSNAKSWFLLALINRSFAVASHVFLYHLGVYTSADISSAVLVQKFIQYFAAHPRMKITASLDRVFRLFELLHTCMTRVLGTGFTKSRRVEGVPSSYMYVLEVVVSVSLAGKMVLNVIPLT